MFNCYMTFDLNSGKNEWPSTFCSGIGNRSCTESRLEYMDVIFVRVLELLRGEGIQTVSRG